MWEFISGVSSQMEKNLDSVLDAFYLQKQGEFKIVLYWKSSLAYR